MRILEKEFTLANRTHLFDSTSHSEGEYIAICNDLCSSFHQKDYFSFKWSCTFPFGRYIIVIYQGCIVLENGS